MIPIQRFALSFLAGSFAIGSGLLHPIDVLAGEVRVYSGRHYATDRQVFKKFYLETGIVPKLIETTDMSIIEKLKREGKNSKADIILLVDAARINNAAKAGLLQSYRSEKLDKEVPSKYRDPKGRWYALTRRVRIIIANPSKVDVSQIKTYADLADPKLKGKVCLRKRNSPYNQSLVADQLVLRGEVETRKWLKGMTSNVSEPYFPGDIALTRDVARGTCGVGIVNHYYVARMLAGINGSRDESLARKVKVITPNPAHVNVSAGGLARYSKNKEEAIKLLEYLASPDGSRGLAGPTFEHPLNGYSQAKELRGFGSVNPDKVTISQLGEYNAKAIRMMTRSGWE